MATLLQKALDRASRLPEEEQERIARLVLAEIPPAKEDETPCEPFRVKPWSFGLPPNLTERELKAMAYGEDD